MNVVSIPKGFCIGWRCRVSSASFGGGGVLCARGWTDTLLQRSLKPGGKKGDRLFIVIRIIAVVRVGTRQKENGCTFERDRPGNLSSRRL